MEPVGIQTFIVDKVASLTARLQHMSAVTLNHAQMENAAALQVTVGGQIPTVPQIWAVSPLAGKLTTSLRAMLKVELVIC